MAVHFEVGDRRNSAKPGVLRREWVDDSGSGYFDIEGDMLHGAFGSHDLLCLTSCHSRTTIGVVGEICVHCGTAIAVARTRRFLCPLEGHDSHHTPRNPLKSLGRPRRSRGKMGLESGHIGNDTSDSMECQGTQSASSQGSKKVFYLLARLGSHGGCGRSYRFIVCLSLSLWVSAIILGE